MGSESNPNKESEEFDFVVFFKDPLADIDRNFSPNDRPNTVVFK